MNRSISEHTVFRVDALTGKNGSTATRKRSPPRANHHEPVNFPFTGVTGDSPP